MYNTYVHNCTLLCPNIQKFNLRVIIIQHYLLFYPRISALSGIFFFWNNKDLTFKQYYRPEVYYNPVLLEQELDIIKKEFD